ncbi:MAG TPA: hypothetical protein VFF06_23535 [Polyangia bacterium]|nr:hypothetical protein [Polyangia bacterium]
MGATTPDQLEAHRDDQLRFLAYFLTRAEATNVAPTNDLLQGRVVGRLFGSNTTQTTSGANFVAEQRLIPFVIFEPRVLDRFARLRLSFEINWTWGDSSYGVGGNFGGAFSGRQINIETQNVEVEFRLLKGWYLNIGLQRLWDNVRNPYNTFFSTISLTGTRLMFWGSDAVGVSLYGQQWGQSFKLGGYVLYENKIQDDDHVLLFEALTSRTLPFGLNVGGSVRYLRDTSSGAGGVSVLGQGPSSPLADYDGAYRFPSTGANYHADLAWVDVNAAMNPEFTAGRWGASAFVVGNFGQLRTKQPDGRYVKAADILGLAANLRLGYRYGNSRNDVIVGDFVYSTGNHNGIAGGRYTGVITGNTYGAPGAPFISSGAYLLLPHSTVVNRFYAAVFDVSNLGYGLSAGTLNVSYDLIRNVLTAKVGGAVGYANVAPSGGGHFIGAEANASLVWRIKVFFAVELHGAYLWLGDFYDSPAVQPGGGGGRPQNPWTVFTDLKWLMF